MVIPLKRLFLLFSVGLILPSAFLIYLGLASLRAENRLREKESAERLGTTADALAVQMVNAIPVAMAAHKGWKSSAVLDSRDQIIEPVRLAPLLSPAWTALTPAQTARLEAIERREFKEKAYAEVAEAYEVLAQDVENPAWKASLFVRAASSRGKAGQWKDAESLYRRIMDHHGQARNEQGLPFGLLASVQLFELHHAAGHISAATDQALEVLKAITARTWALSWNDEDFFTKRISERLKTWAPAFSPAQASRWSFLQATLAAREQEAGRLMKWRAEDWPRIQTLLRRYNRLELPTLLWPEKAGAFALWVNPERKALGDARASTLVAWCDSAVLQADWARSLAANPHDEFEAKVEAARENKLGTLSRPLEGVLPPHHLVLHPLGGSVGDAYAHKRRQIYIAMVSLAGLVIFVALGVTWLAVTREMEVAQLKSQFVASMSHELKTPLSIIDLVGQKLKLGRYESANDVQEYYAMLSDETTRLKGLIEDVLDFSRLMENRAPYAFTSLDWLPVIRETIQRFQSGVGSGHPVPFETTLQTCRILGNSEALGRVLSNLLENALKYSPPERVDIRAALNIEGFSAVLSVIDRGYGIAVDEKKLIFDRFYRARSASQERPIAGTGLGLSIVQHIVQAHGGTVEVQSTLHEGSVFRVRLPLEKTA